ncbi:ABC transporter permease [Haloimpatiens sp. FM7315]|uniref:ABC transporter permease n=1 Tax=Haloimpatiens sp. FM7315 TaxID=3298609 RepID=UPI00370B8E1C
MNIFNVLMKELKIQFRDKKAMSIMTIFPIILIVILGTAFSGSFKNTTIISDVKVGYFIEDKGQLTSAMSKFTEEFHNLDIKFNKIESKEEGINNVKNCKYDVFINVNSKNKKIELYKNERYNLTAGLIENIMDIFVDKCNLNMELYRINPVEAGKIISEKEKEPSFISLKTLNGKNSPRAKDYYSITMISLIILYSSLAGTFSIKAESYNNTKNRLFYAPVKKFEVFIGKTMGLTIITFFQILLVFLFSKYILKTYWGEHILLELIIFLTLIIMSLSIGMAVAFLFKSDEASSAGLNSIIPIFAFLGGAYAPINFKEGSIFMNICKISPLKWTNDGLLKLIYANDTSYVGIAIAINLTIAVILLIFSSLMFRKEEA